MQINRQNKVLNKLLNCVEYSDTEIASDRFLYWKNWVKVYMFLVEYLYKFINFMQYIS